VRLRGASVWLAATVAASACGAASTTSTLCQRDAQCMSGFACMASTCLAVASPPQTWAVELAPLPDATMAAFTELPSVTLSTSALAVMATAAATVTGTLTLEASVAPLATAHVLLTVPATILGRPDLQFQTDLPPGGSSTAPTFSLAVPSGILGRAATLRVLPAPPDDATHAPALFAVTLAPTLQVTLPAKSFAVRGRLQSPLHDAQGGFVARAYLGDELVSNVVATATDGTFALMVPAGRVTATQMVSVRIEPPVGDGASPRYTSKLFALAGDVDLGDLLLPVSGQPNRFRFIVTGDTSTGPAVTGALVRVFNTVSDDVGGGTTGFLRDAQTDAAGDADLDLLPGTTTALRSYVIAVVPPPDSHYASACLAQVQLASGGSAVTPFIPPTIVLSRRAQVTGTVLGVDGTPVVGATILATPAAPDAASPCAALAGVPPTPTATLTKGAYAFFLDPGSYRFDVDPPAGAPFPRLTELAVAVAATGAPLTHVVNLPAGFVLAGTTLDALGAALPQAGVSLFAPTSLLLEAQGHADVTGHFRVVVAAP
jgi:hypothetical protein